MSDTDVNQRARGEYIILFCDMQDGVIGGDVRTVTAERLKATSGVLAKLATLHSLPVFASCIPDSGAYLDSILSGAPALKPRQRTYTTAFADAGLVAELKAAGRSTIVLAGCVTEIVVLRTALDALAAGYKVQVAVDACGGVDSRTEEAAFRTLVASGAVTTSSVTVGADLAGDFSQNVGTRTFALIQRAIHAAGRSTVTSRN